MNLFLMPSLLPFGAGRRVCVGKNMANNRLFLFLVSIIQKFKFRPKEKDEIKWNIKNLETGLILSHKPYKMIFELRKK